MTQANVLAQLGAQSGPTFRNRIINGAMVIDQRNAGASVAITTAAPFITDRFFSYASQTSKLTGQQNAGSVTPPVGFTNYLGFTSQSAYSITSTDIFGAIQRIEGFNTADLGWGTANAKTVTLSFQVYSSLTGTFGGSLQNSAQNRSYPFSFTISSANTWTAISITIAGDTTGTWIGATNGIGIQVNFSLGIGSTYSSTAGAWASANYFSATGATSVVGTSGATFYITGVQLEVGSSATGFEYVNYQTSLANCQRYCYVTSAGANFNGGCESTTTADFTIYHPVPMRATPTLTVSAVWKADNYATVAATSSSASGSGVSAYQSTLNAQGFSPSFTSKDNVRIIPSTNAGVATISAEL